MDPVTWAALGSTAAGTAGSAAAGAAATTAAVGTAVDTAIAASPALFGTSAAISSGLDLAIAGAPEVFGAGAAAATGDAVAGAAGGFNFARMFNVGSTIFNAGGAIMSGISAKQEKDYEAAQLDQNAKAEVAAATRKMQLERRDTDIAESRVRNLAAAGGGALDPSVVNILGDLESEGTTNIQNTLYNANSAAHGMESQAIASRFSGKNSLTAGGISAVGSLFKGIGQSMSGKYGDAMGYG